MKDVSHKALEQHKESLARSAPELVGFCLRRLYADREHTIGQEVVRSLVFEVLIGAIQAAREYFRATERRNEEVVDWSSYGGAQPGGSLPAAAPPANAGSILRGSAKPTSI